MNLPLSVHGTTHPGLVHETNDDSWAVVPSEEGGLLLMVCDGMGGMGRGDEASAVAVEVLTEEMRHGTGYPPGRLRQAIRQADLVVRERLCSEGTGLPGSTAILVYVVDGVGHVAWVGDSRAYLLREGALHERTDDHKLVNELMAAGQMTEEEAKTSTLAHVVTRALGGRPPGEKAVTGATLGHPWKLAHGDVVILCSDGISDLVTDEELPGIVVGLDPEPAAAALVQVALDRGGHDNITCIVARWDGPTYVEDDVATPLMPGPREAAPEPLEEAAIVDDRPGAGRVTEEIDISEAAEALGRTATPPPPPAAGPTADAAAEEASRSTPAPEVTGYDGTEGGRAWIILAVAVVVLLIALGLVVLGG